MVKASFHLHSGIFKTDQVKVSETVRLLSHLSNIIFTMLLLALHRMEGSYYALSTGMVLKALHLKGNLFINHFFTCCQNGK